MSGNTFGKIFKLTTFGESHGLSIGGVIDGCPPGIKFNISFIQDELNKRKPGQSSITTSRKEDDIVEIQSGVFEGVTTGTPIGFIIKNKDQNSKDYSNIKDVFRPSHADYTYQEKYGVRDYRGGGRSSARETACRVVGGAFAKLILNEISDIKVHSFVTAVGHLKDVVQKRKINNISKNILRAADLTFSSKAIKFIESLKLKGDSTGGIISTSVENMPTGLGEPVFNKLEAQLAYAMLSINAVKGFEVGAGFNGTTIKGSEHNDEFFIDENDKVSTSSNKSGGIQGGISNGMNLFFNTAFKPTATILSKQNTVDVHHNSVEIKVSGRHDPCVLPRAVAIVESMTNMVLLDFILLQKTKLRD